VLFTGVVGVVGVVGVEGVVGVVGVEGVLGGVSVLGLALVAVAELDRPEPHPAAIKQQTTTTTKQIPYFRAIPTFRKSSYKLL
jgi:hypothetical protein